MFMNITKLTYVIRCNSAYSSQKTREVLESVIRPEVEVTRTFFTCPGGVERREIRAFRIADYFDSIDIHFIDQLNFYLSFQVIKSADRFWKDLVVSVIRSITDNHPEVSAIPVIPSL